MGIVQSCIQCLCGDDEKYERLTPNPRANAAHNYYYSNNYSGGKSDYPRRDNNLASSHQRQKENCFSSAHSQQTKHLTVSVPSLIRNSTTTTSFARTSTVNHNKVKCSPTVIIKKNTPENVSRGKGEQKGRSEQAPLMIKYRTVAPPQPPPPEVRWIKHYSSSHRILLVGEGDFSFSACLVAAFGCASNMVATSLDSQAFLVKNYRNARSNLLKLSNGKCKVMHEIDVTEMANNEFLGRIKFDRIVYNFPYAGFFKNLSRDAQLRLHRNLVIMFLKNAREMLSAKGEIHISHKTNGFHSEWKLESLAFFQRLRLIDAVDFNLLEYPGYNTKCGFGGDNNFNCYPSKTYKFVLQC